MLDIVPPTPEIFEAYLAKRAHMFEECEEGWEKRSLKECLQYEVLALEYPHLHRMYVYRLTKTGKRMSESIIRNIEPMPDIEEFLQKECGPGGYQVMIKRGRDMVLRFDCWVA